jgi:hypothetical protein
MDPFYFQFDNYCMYLFRRAPEDDKADRNMPWSEKKLRQYYNFTNLINYTYNYLWYKRICTPNITPLMLHSQGIESPQIKRLFKDFRSLALHREQTRRCAALSYVFAHTIRKQGGAGHCSLQSLIQSLDD